MAFRSSMSLFGSLMVLLLVSAGLPHLPAWRLDLTEEKLYTLSAGTRQLVRKLDEPITLRFYFSEETARAIPQLHDYGRRVHDLLNEYSLLDPALLSVEVIDPEPFSDQEDQALAAGIQAAPLAVGESLYLGLVGSNADDVEETIAFFSPQRENFLEYDISQMLYRLSQPGGKAVAVLSGVQMFGGFDFSTGQMQPGWAVVDMLRSTTEVRELSLPLRTVDDDVGVLMLVSPEPLDETALYAIDQFAMRGGALLIFVDPQLEVAGETPAADQAVDGEAGLQTLFNHWGLQVDQHAVTLDRRRALRVSSAASATPLPHLGVLGLQVEDMNQEDIVTANLESLNLASVGSLALAEQSTLRFQPLLQTTTDSMALDLADYGNFDDKSQLLNQFHSGGRRRVVAARISGAVTSAYTAAPNLDSDVKDAASSSAENAGTEQISERPHLSNGNLNAIIVADADMLADRLWVQATNFFGQRMVLPWAGNGDFVANAVDNLSGSDTLINLRSRGTYSRPFEKVEALRADAARQFKQREQQLLQQLEELEQRISSLAPEGDQSEELLLSGDQQAEVARFEAQRLDTRKQLRQVQRELNRSIEDLELRLRWLNMGLVPGVLMLLMLLVFWRRRSRSGL